MLANLRRKKIELKLRKEIVLIVFSAYMYARPGLIFETEPNWNVSIVRPAWMPVIQ
mgnify:CR=1 FL=1